MPNPVAQYQKILKQLYQQCRDVFERVDMEKSELETTITYDMDQKLVRIFSAIRRDQTKVEKMGFKPVYGDDRGYGYEVPLTRLKWRITTGIKSNRGFAKKTPSK